MKINIPLFFLVLAFASPSFAQLWTAKPITPFANTHKFVRHISVPQKDLIWVGSRHNYTDKPYTLWASSRFARSLDGGDTWNSGLIGTDTTMTVTSICAINKDTAFATLANLPIGYPYDGALFRTYDGGNTWTEVNGVFASCFADWVCFSDKTNGAAMGDPLTDGGPFQFYFTLNAGATWLQSPTLINSLAGEYGSMGCAVIGDTIYSASNKGRIFKSTDKGMTWSVIQTPFNFLFADINAKNSNELIAASEEGALSSSIHGLLKSNDGGNTWSWSVNAATTVQNTALASNASYVKGTNDTYVWCGLSNLPGTVISHDGGLTWAQIETAASVEEANDGPIWLDANTGYATSNYMNGAWGPQLLVWNGGTLSNYTPFAEVNMDVYPNPTKEKITISTPFLKHTNLKISLTDAMGKEIFHFSQEEFIGEYETTIDLESYPSGVYTLNTFIGPNIVSQRFVKE